MAKRAQVDATHASTNKSKSKRKLVSKPDEDEVPKQKTKSLSGWEEVEAIEDTKIQTDTLKDEEKQKMSKNVKKRIKEDKERAIRDAERRHLVGSSAPTTTAEFEQLVLSSPNSSFIWIKYMAFLISLGEIDHARTIAERAIQSINYREEAEKLNIWVAWINIENLYGNEESTLQLLHRALTHTDARKLYLAAIDVFDKTDKESLTEECLKAMCRKFSARPDVWLRAFKYRLTRNDPEGAKKTFDRAMQSLPRHDHITMTSQAALMEFKVGDAERGRSMFENILQNYPRRLDLWSVYIDQEIVHGDDNNNRIRGLFERATHLMLPPKKMKFLFKRYLDFEKKNGDEKSVEHVKKKAMEFVERASSAI